MSRFHHRHSLRLLGFTSAKSNSLLQLAAKLEADKESGKEEARLTDKSIALIFEKDSTCTRCSFEVAVYDQGARVTYPDPNGNQIDHKEPIKDTARMLSRMYDGIQYHGYDQEIVEILAEYAGMSVWNDLTDESHPTQLLADLLIVQKRLSGRAFNGMTLAYVGDTRNNMGNSMFEAAALTSLDLRLVVPQACWPEAALVTECSALVQRHGGKITSTGDIASGVKDTDFIYTDVWVSTGESEKKWAERIVLLCDYQANSKMMALTGNSQVKLFHCPPVFHNEQATLGKEMAIESGLYDGVEVADEVSESPASIIFDQTENRMHAIKAAVVATLTR